MDHIIIENLEVFAKHGVYKEEKALLHKFLVCADLCLDTRTAGLSDELSGTINYGKVCHLIEKFMTGNQFNLIESAAEFLARELLLKFKPLVQEVTITIKKPWAPIGLPLETAAVSIHRQWHRAYLSIGSNMGDKRKYIKDAMASLRKHKLVRLTASSDIIETEPYGNTDQDKFLNNAVEIRTLLTPVELLSFCNEIEKEAGRERKEHWGPRTLDIDILFYDNEVVNLRAPLLSIPHPDLQNRKFVLEPMNQIAPGFIHPIYGQSIRSLYERLN